MLRKLENGYTVIAVKPDDGRGQMSGTIVLAVNDSLTQYAVWWQRYEDGKTFDGDYFPIQAYADSREQFRAAVDTYMERQVR